MKHKLKLGTIMPGGWLKDSLEKNMEGCIGHLDQLVPELLVNQEIYGRDRLGKDAELTDLGRIETEQLEMEGPKEQYLWWNSESQSNWLDGYCRSAFLIVDALYQLFHITGNREYVDYAVWLYEDFSKHQVSEEDLKICNIENPDYFFRSHGVHTYEHIRALIIAAYTDNKYMPLLHMLLTKLPFYITPSGGPIGDEWIFGRTADASLTGYEFCSVHELMHSYLLLMSVSGNLSWADKAEWLYYNAAQGMIHPEDSSIMYCKTDNCYEANEYRCPGDGHYNPRYKYSPTHQDAAVCCVPNSGRITPYFIESMFLKTEQGYVAALYGPCTLKDTWQDTEIMIKEYTDYPYAFPIRFEVTVSKPSKFSLSFRFPEWADSMTIDNQIYNRKSTKDDLITIDKIWEGITEVEMNMTGAVKFNKDFNGDVFISRGPLVYALPIISEKIVLKEMKVQGWKVTFPLI